MFIAGILFSCQQNRFQQGAVLYENFCANCHMENGQGLGELYPPLAGADYLKNHFDEVPCIIQNGMKGPVLVNGVTYDMEMLPIPQLGEVEISNIMNFMNHEWELQQAFTNPTEVKERLNSCK